MEAEGTTNKPVEPQIVTTDRPTARRVFLTVSALAAIAVCLAAQAVMLPFVLALVVAYVLTPAVLRVERNRVPRWVAILLVYAMTLGTIGGFISLIVPRLVSEGKALAVEWPNLNRKVRHEWLPAIDTRIARWTGQAPTPALPEPNATQELHGPVAEPKHEEHPPMRIVKRDDGSYDVHLSDDLRLREVESGTWTIVNEQPQRLSSATMLRQAFDKGILYLRQNATLFLK